MQRSCSWRIETFTCLRFRVPHWYHMTARHSSNIQVRISNQMSWWCETSLVRLLALQFWWHTSRLVCRTAQGYPPDGRCGSQRPSQIARSPQKLLPILSLYDERGTSIYQNRRSLTKNVILSQTTWILEPPYYFLRQRITVTGELVSAFHATLPSYLSTFNPHDLAVCGESVSLCISCLTCHR